MPKNLFIRHASDNKQIFFSSNELCRWFDENIWRWLDEIMTTTYPKVIFNDERHKYLMYFNSLLSPENQLNKDSNISDIANQVSNAWLSHPMPKTDSTYYNNDTLTAGKKINRSIHGLQHACRVSIYIPFIANLYRKYGMAQDLTEKDIKLLQIAALFHDSGRKGEEEDLWELESAELCFHFLVSLGYGKEDAIRAAEAIANKDLHYSPGERHYGLGIYDRIYIEDNKIIWKQKKRTPNHDSSFRQILHDSDCFDIMRARDGFDGKQLEFYKQIAKKNDDAFNTLATLIPEIHKFITYQGDGRHAMDFATKEKYELAPNCFTTTENDLNDKGEYPLLCPYYNNGKLLPHEELNNIKPVTLPEYDANITTLTAENLTKALYDPKGRIYSRGILTPSLVPDDFLGRIGLLPLYYWKPLFNNLDEIINKHFDDLDEIINKYDEGRAFIYCCFELSRAHNIADDKRTDNTDGTALTFLIDFIRDTVISLNGDKNHLDFLKTKLSKFIKNNFCYQVINLDEPKIDVDLMPEKEKRIIDCAKKEVITFNWKFKDDNKLIYFLYLIADRIITVAEKKDEEKQSFADKELQKTLYTYGNMKRSVALLGPTTLPFAPAGFLLISPENYDIKEVHTTDINSGRGKKRQLKTSNSPVSECKLRELKKLTLLGGKTLPHLNSAINELIVTIYGFDAIYFTRQLTLGYRALFQSSRKLLSLQHKHSPLLEAIYLYQAYKKKTNGKELQIFEYSAIDNKFTEHKIPSDDELLAIWHQVIDATFKEPAFSISTLLFEKMDYADRYTPNFFICDSGSQQFGLSQDMYAFIKTVMLYPDSYVIDSATNSHTPSRANHICRYYSATLNKKINNYILEQFHQLHTITLCSVLSQQNTEKISKINFPNLKTVVYGCVESTNDAMVIYNILGNFPDISLIIRTHKSDYRPNKLDYGTAVEMLLKRSEALAYKYREKITFEDYDEKKPIEEAKLFFTNELEKLNQERPKIAASL